LVIQNQEVIMRLIHSNRRYVPLAFLAMSLVFFINDASAKRVKKEGFLGITVESLSHEEKREEGVAFGVLVWEVMENSPAEKAGLKEDDIIQYYDNKKVKDPEDLVQYVRRSEPGSKIEIAISRDGNPKKIEVTLGSSKSSKRDQFYYPMHSGAKGYLGVKLQDVNEDLSRYFEVKENEGALILEVTEDSPAEEAGLKPGDVILKIENETICEAQDVSDLMEDYEEGDTVTLQIKRHGKIQNIKVELGDSPRMFNFPKYWDNHSSCSNQPRSSSHRIVIPDSDIDWDEIGNEIQIKINGEALNLGEALDRYFENFSIESEL